MLLILSENKLTKTLKYNIAKWQDVPDFPESVRTEFVKDLKIQKNVRAKLKCDLFGVSFKYHKGLKKLRSS